MDDKRAFVLQWLAACHDGIAADTDAEQALADIRAQVREERVQRGRATAALLHDTAPLQPRQRNDARRTAHTEALGTQQRRSLERNMRRLAHYQPRYVANSRITVNRSVGLFKKGIASKRLSNAKLRRSSFAFDEDAFHASQVDDASSRTRCLAAGAAQKRQITKVSPRSAMGQRKQLKGLLMAHSAPSTAELSRIDTTSQHSACSLEMRRQATLPRKSVEQSDQVLPAPLFAHASDHSSIPVIPEDALTSAPGNSDHLRYLTSPTPPDHGPLAKFGCANDLPSAKPLLQFAATAAPSTSSLGSDSTISTLDQMLRVCRDDIPFYTCVDRTFLSHPSDLEDDRAPDVNIDIPITSSPSSSYESASLWPRFWQPNTL
ncbi:hypothetical protein E5Q_00095 [Mixia osmundae IAM 14324]|uniref:Uncharacterized protein n=1 Tax=Mixia osmundae (strain CBS 9802 / IAM 14324 / JCM 22182 / KY 12970) TaxID=764103 RepID=G7DS95_MIXOS|nr:hypothetical protein E5Q_00095 [Mixia osmundae IAM 14324]